MKENLKHTYSRSLCVEIKWFLKVTDSREENKFSQTTSYKKLINFSPLLVTRSGADKEAMITDTFIYCKAF